MATITTVQERINGLQAKIQKKLNTIEKKTARREKLMFAMETSADERERRSLEWDIRWLSEDIDRLNKEVAECKKSLEKWESKVDEARKDEKVLEEIPEALEQFRRDTVEKYNQADKELKAKLRKLYDEMDYHEFMKKYKFSGYQAMMKTDEEIERDNERDVRSIILNLVYRTHEIAGEIVDAKGLRVTIGTHGYPVVNGLIFGKKGRVTVESIICATYSDLVREHVRVIVKERN